MMRSLGVARVRSVKAMQILLLGWIQSQSGFAERGLASASRTADFSWGRPTIWSGSMTVVTSSGKSTER